MEETSSPDQWIDISIGMNAIPPLTIGNITGMPVQLSTDGPTGFSINLEAQLPYHSLSKIINAYLKGKTFELADGLFKKQVEVRSASLAGSANGELLVNVEFTGSFNGTLNLSGKPVYHEDKMLMEVANLEYSLDTRSLLLKTAKWLFNRMILQELNRYTIIELAPYFAQAREKLDQGLNREWSKGIRGKGSVTELQASAVQALPQHLLIRTRCKGNMAIDISEFPFQV